MRKPSVTNVRPGADHTPGSPDPDAQGQAQEPYLRFYHSIPLREKTLAVLDALEHSAEPTEYRAALSGIVVDLTRCGMDAYFTKPLKDAKAGFVVEQTASLGMTGAVQLLSSVISSIIGRMGPPQLLSVSSSIRRFMQ
jgi:hypothetical protein